ncbi:MAG: cupin domain-containing protein [Candidatus Cloacimonetes bacterium]|nr:cupin domain-containing protein [Candidatus Cloacimonadota bacterium]
MQSYRDIIERLNLLPHPEGGYYRRNWQSELEAEAQDTTGKKIHSRRSIGSSILYLLPFQEVSAWHRVSCDEMWHYYAGSPLKLILISKQHGMRQQVLGNNLHNDELPQFIIPRNTWFCAEVIEIDSYSFCGCTLWPSFSYADFELANKERLLEEFPEHRDLINHIFDKQKFE